MELSFTYGNLKIFVEDYIKERVHHDLVSEVSMDHKNAIVDVRFNLVLKS